MLNELLHSIRCWGFVVLILFLTPVSSFAALYNVVDRPVGTTVFTLNGFIETDGTLGPLASNNITRFKIEIFQPGVVGPLDTLISPPVDGSIVSISGDSFVASPTELNFDFGSTGDSFRRVAFQDFPNTGRTWTLQNREEQVLSLGGVNHISIPPGNQLIASAPVPSPSAMLLMGTGLAGLVVFRRWQGRTQL